MCRKSARTPLTDTITERLLVIDGAVTGAFDLGARADAKRKAGSRREAYERARREVRDLVGAAQGRALANWNEEEIRRDRRVPSAPQAPKRGAKSLRESRHEVSTANRRRARGPRPPV